MKYEYMLHTWGGFYNKEHQEKHGYKKGYFGFDTKEAREAYISELKEVEQRLKAFCLAISTEEGEHVRYRTIAKIVFVYQGKEYPYEYDFGFAYPAESAEYMFSEGNYACDCNRSLFLSRINDDFPELECGDEIEMKSFEVVFTLDQAPESVGGV
jgi:hypothetical protein